MCYFVTPSQQLNSEPKFYSSFMKWPAHETCFSIVLQLHSSRPTLHVGNLLPFFQFGTAVADPVGTCCSSSISVLPVKMPASSQTHTLALSLWLSTAHLCPASSFWLSTLLFFPSGSCSVTQKLISQTV